MAIIFVGFFFGYAMTLAVTTGLFGVSYYRGGDIAVLVGAILALISYLVSEFVINRDPADRTEWRYSPATGRYERVKREPKSLRALVAAWLRFRQPLRRMISRPGSRFVRTFRR